MASQENLVLNPLSFYPRSYKKGTYQPNAYCIFYDSQLNPFRFVYPLLIMECSIHPFDYSVASCIVEHGLPLACRMGKPMPSRYRF